jgi:RimJ/RimL family protein N-acetyltransferase
VTGAVQLVAVDGRTAAEVRGSEPASRPFAAGFPRVEDLDALDARVRGALAYLVVADGLVVGTCGTHGAPRGDGIVELGWGLVEAARGRGVGTTAVGLLLELVAERHRDAVLLARTQWALCDGVLVPQSAASEAILRRYGFDPEPAPTRPGLRRWQRRAQPAGSPAR